MALKQSIIKYLNMAREFPDKIVENRRLLAQNLLVLNTLRTGANTGLAAAFFNKQLQKYQYDEKALLEISQKHSMTKSLIDRYPEFKETFPGMIGMDLDLSMFDGPVIAAVAVLTGSILTLYDDVTNRIKAQNDILNKLYEEKQKLNTGAISQADYNAFITTLDKTVLTAPAVNFGGVMVITGLIFGGYYAINNPDKVKKTIRKVLKA